MKQSHFNNLKIYRYFFIAFILILGILAFYVSCKSKSPTDAHGASNDALAAQGAKSTTQTTSSSSTTTTVRPGQSPTNTTTLITSRTLTSTSTRTTTTSSSTTTTSRKLTTTTSAGVCNLEWCQVTVTINSGTPIVVQDGDNIFVYPGDEVRISISVKNSGTAPTGIATNAMVFTGSNPPGSFIFVDTQETLGAIPADNECHTWSDVSQINVSGSASSNDICIVTIVITPIDCSSFDFDFLLMVTS